MLLWGYWLQPLQHRLAQIHQIDLRALSTQRVHRHVFPCSLCGWKSIPSSVALCPYVTCPEIFSCLQSVTFNLASFLELQSLIVFVLSCRFVLPLCPKVLIYNYACGRAVKAYTSPKHWAWSYHLVCDHCRLAERRFSKELSTHQQFSLPRAIAVC